MKAGVITKVNTVEYKDMPDPVLEPGKAIVKVAYAGYCGPTEQAIIGGMHPRATFPLINCHEFSGVIEKSNPGSGYKPGDRVIVFPLLYCGGCYVCKEGNSYICTHLGLIGIDCDGGFAEYCSVPERNLVRVPDGMSDMAAAFTEPVAVCLHAIRGIGFKVGGTALVTGAGPIGLITAECLRVAGAERVIVAEIEDRRVEFAKKCGFEVVKEISSLGKEAFDCVFETTGAEAVLPAIVDAVKIAGKIAIVGKYDFPAKVNLHDVLFKEITMKGFRVYREEEFEQALKLIGLNEERFTRYVTDTYPLDQITQAVKDFDCKKNLCKILVKI